MNSNSKTLKRSIKQGSHPAYEPFYLNSSSDDAYLDDPSQYLNQEPLKSLKQKLSGLNDKIESGGYTFFKAMICVFGVLFAAATFFNFIKLFRISSNRFTTFFDLIFYGLQAYQLRLEYESIVEKDARKARKTLNYMILFMMMFTVTHLALLGLIHPRSFFEEHHIFDDKHEASAVAYAESQIQTMRRINFYFQETIWGLFLLGAFMVKRMTLKIFQASQEINSQTIQLRRKSSW